MSQVRFSQVSPPRQALIRLCQAINFGSIEDLIVERAEPVFDPPPVVLKDVKLDSDEGPRSELTLADFVVGNEILRLMNHLDKMGHGVLRRMEVRAGIPRRIMIESPLMGLREGLALN